MAERRGRPRLTWLSGEQLSGVPMGTAVVLDLGTHKTVTRGRVAGCVEGHLVLADGRRVPVARIKRGRVVNGTYEMGDLVLRRGVPETEWRGGVIRSRGLEVLVESTTGIEWMPEHALELAANRGPSNARAREERTIAPLSA